ncbi:hypothetical protein K490DRAFT_60640 [Saccharata proteae CBS 121410]|uniref:Uncharacterized protein n=1 Tax=Saccharata proteae CBS 121410 TaxID=1314787 RepID=A0A9P4HN07_9PEZI|nr:hypothetical protein K490DRAFT_60640 [Saccharata proteae CBS 121410]
MRCRLFTLLLSLNSIYHSSFASTQLLGLNFGLNLGNGDNDLPTLTLPYGIHRAAKYNANADIYTFKTSASPPTSRKQSLEKAEITGSQFVDSRWQLRTYATETYRTKAFVRDTFVTCNSRYQTGAFNGSTWKLQYSVTPGIHVTDLIPTFYQLYLGLHSNLSLPLVSPLDEFAKTYQS